MNNITEAIQALQEGRIILLTDDEARENEADMVFPGELITPEIMNFLIQHGSGIVCISLPEEVLRHLGLPLMVAKENNCSRYGTPFTISVDAAQGITTGVSAADRARTIQVLLDNNAQSENLVRPGHVYPLQAQLGGVLERAGHTEGAADLVHLAGFQKAAVLCELMNPDGSMAKGQKVTEFAKIHHLPLVSLQDLIHYRLQYENQISTSTSTTITLEKYGEFIITAMKEKYFPYEHLSLFKAPKDLVQPLLVRIHSACMTGEVFGSRHCDCHDQLHHALQRMSQEGGLLIYLDQEGRGIGLFHKIQAYALQAQGWDTLTANTQLGLPIDARQYYIAAHILRERGVSEIRLLINNPHKVENLRAYGIQNIIQESTPTFLTPENQHYLRTKKESLCHRLLLS